MVDGVIPKFDAVDVAISLSGEELDRYFELSERRKSIRSRLHVAYPELEAMEGDAYCRHLRHLKSEEAEDDGPVSQLFLTYYKRAAISYEAAAKLKLVPQIIDLLVSNAHKKVLVFFERIWTAEFGQDDLVERVAKHIKDQLCGSPDDPMLPHWQQKCDSTHRTRTIAGIEVLVSFLVSSSCDRLGMRRSNFISICQPPDVLLILSEIFLNLVRPRCACTSSTAGMFFTRDGPRHSHCAVAKMMCVQPPACDDELLSDRTS